MHPLLPTSTAIEYGHRAAVGLERQGHISGVGLASRIDQEDLATRLHWPRPEPGAEAQLDVNRVTEDAAEGVALALVHVARGWVVRRRAQRGEAADWFLHDPQARSVALEISGMDRAEIAAAASRLREKVEQVRKAPLAPMKAACVMVLGTPSATVATV